MVSVRTGVATDAGRVRLSNEDSVLVGTAMFAVADGMGGHAAGDVASGLAVARLEKLSGRRDLKPDDVREQIAQANQDILASARQEPGRAGMGTTVAGLSLIHFAGTEHWIVFNVGDSRVYRFVDGTLVQMTVDHSEVEDLVAAGTLSPDQARSHPRRNVVTRALGSDPAPQPDVWVFPPTPGERFVICSDGLPLELSDAQIAEVLGARPTAQQAADALVRTAVGAGGRDNVTVVVVDHLCEDVQLPDDEDATAFDTAPRQATGEAFE